MKYSGVACALAALIPQMVLADGGLHGNRVSGSLGTYFGDVEIDGQDPDTSANMAVRMDYFVDPHTYLIGQISHKVMDYTFNGSTEFTNRLSVLGFGAGREVPVNQQVAFYAETGMGLGWGNAKFDYPNRSESYSVEATQLHLELGFRGIQGRDQWSIGGLVTSARSYFDDDLALVDDKSLDAFLTGHALFRLTDPMLLGPYAHVSHGESEVGLLLRVTGWE